MKALLSGLLGIMVINGVSISDSSVPHEDIDKEVAHAEKHKFDEVNNLMSKYDKAEERIKYLASPEYAEKQEKMARDKETQKQQEIMDKKAE